MFFLLAAFPGDLRLFVEGRSLRVQLIEQDQEEEEAGSVAGKVSLTNVGESRTNSDSVLTFSLWT